MSENEKRMFLVMNVPGPSWDPAVDRRKQDGWDEHAAFMDGLVEQGVIVVGGPAGDGQETLILVDAADEEAVTKIFSEDPWSGTFLQIDSIVPWTIWLDGRPARS